MDDDVERDLAMVVESHAGLYAWLEEVGEADPSQPSALDGWTAGHVMTHLARNADSFSNVLEAAARGEVGVQYPGGDAQRNGDIADGSERTWPELVADLITANHRLDAAFHAATEGMWQDGVADLSRGRAPIAELPFRRTREVEVHRLDLDLGASPEDWPPRWIEREWEVSTSALGPRLPAGVSVVLRPDDGDPVLAGSGDDPIEVGGSRRELIAWIIGRVDLPDAPRLSSWP